MQAMAAVEPKKHPLPVKRKLDLDDDDDGPTKKSGAVPLALPHLLPLPDSALSSDGVRRSLV